MSHPPGDRGQPASCGCDPPRDEPSRDEPWQTPVAPDAGRPQDIPVDDILKSSLKGMSICLNAARGIVDEQHRAVVAIEGAWDAIEGRPDPQPHRRWGHVIAAGREANDAAKAVFYITKQLQRLLDRRLDRLMNPLRP